MILLDLYRDDAILADKEMGRFSLDVKNQNSTIRQTEFTLCSDRMEQNFPGYELDKICRVVPGPHVETINFKQLKDLLLSTDETKDVGFGPCETFKFLDCKSDMSEDMVSFQSYARCGNTFLRRYIE